MVTQYLVKYRKLSFALMGAAIPLGSFVFDPLIFALSERLHWREAFFLLSAINLNLLLAAVAFFKPRKVDTEDDESADESFARSSTGSPENSKLISRCCRLLDDFMLLSNVNIVLFIISMFMMCLGSGAFRTHVAKYAELQGHTTVKVVSLPIIFSGSLMTFRLLTGIILQVFNVDVVVLYIVLISSGGVFILCYAMTSNYIVLAAMASLIGICISMLTMYPEVVVALVGIDKLAAASALLCLASAIGFLCGGPIAAFLYQLDPSYLSSFLIAGLSVIAGGLILIPAAINSRRTSEC